MNEYTSQVIICLIGAIVSIVTILMSKKQNKVLQKIDEQTLFIEKEKGLKQKLNAKEKEVQATIHDIMVLILDTNLSIMNNTQINDPVLMEKSKRFKEKADELKQKYSAINKDIDELQKEYDIVLDMTYQFQKEMKELENKK